MERESHIQATIRENPCCHVEDLPSLVEWRGRRAAGFIPTLGSRGFSYPLAVAGCRALEEMPPTLWLSTAPGLFGKAPRSPVF